MSSGVCCHDPATERFHRDLAGHAEIRPVEDGSLQGRDRIRAGGPTTAEDGDGHRGRIGRGSPGGKSDDCQTPGGEMVAITQERSRPVD